MRAFEDPHTRAAARLAGLLYMLIAIAGFFSILWVPAQLTVANDPIATGALIAETPGLFAAGVAGDVIMMLAEVVLSVLLYLMLRSYGPLLALSAMVARLMMAAVMAAMLLPQAGIFAIAVSDLPLVGLSPDQSADVAWILRHIHDAGVWVWQIFFTLHLILLGVLALRVKAVPDLLAVGLMIGGLGYISDSIRAFAFPDVVWFAQLSMILLVIVTVAEVSFALRLLLWGRIAPKPDKIAS